MPNPVPAEQPFKDMGSHVTYREPRISAGKLAEYVIANPVRKMAIVQQAKNQNKAIPPLYHHVRGGFANALSSQGLDPNYFTQRAAEVEAIPPGTDWQIGDNERSVQALKHLSTLAGEIDCAAATAIAVRWKPLTLGGVRVTVSPDLVFSIVHKGLPKIGAVILSTTLNGAGSLAKNSEGVCIGDYLTALLFRLLREQARELGMPLHTRCYAIDIFRQKVYKAPAAHRTLDKHLEESCKMIALQWAAIPALVEAEVSTF